MKKNLFKLSILASSILFANEPTAIDMEKKVREVLPANAPISKIEGSEIKNLYKAFLTNGQIIYIEPNEKLLIFGEIVRPDGYSYTREATAKWQSELEQKEIEGVNAKKLTAPSLKIDFGKGSTQYEFVIFTDPECPYCHKAEDTFKEKDVTVYVNFLPLDFHKNAKAWSLDILSSKNPKQTASDIKNGKFAKITHTKEAISQLAKMEEIAKELKITGTPRLYVIDKKLGKVVDVINGANIPKIEKYLN